MTAPRRDRAAEFSRALAADPPAAVAELEADLRAAGGPIVEAIDGDDANVTATFVAIQRADAVHLRTPLAATDMAAAMLGVPMHRIGSSDVWLLALRADLRTSTIYEFLVDPPSPPEGPLPDDDGPGDSFMRALADASRLDPFNPDSMLTLDGDAGEDGDGPRVSVMTLPGADPPQWPEASASTGLPAGGGTMRDLVVPSTGLGGDRLVTVYLPPGIEPTAVGAALLPGVVFLGGDSFLRVAHTSQTLDRLIVDRAIPPLMGVFLHHDRSGPGMGDLLATGALTAVLTDDVLPAVRATFPMAADASDIAVAGFSIGGLGAALLGFQRPDVFGNVIALSPSTWIGETIDGEPEWLARQFAAADVRPLRFWIDVGALETTPIPYASGLTMVTGARHLRTVLTAKGYEVVGYREQPGGHDFANWRRGLAQAMVALFGDRAGASDTSG